MWSSGDATIEAALELLTRSACGDFRRATLTFISLSQPTPGPLASVSLPRNLPVTLLLAYSTASTEHR